MQKADRSRRRGGDFVVSDGRLREMGRWIDETKVEKVQVGEHGEEPGESAEQTRKKREGPPVAAVHVHTHTRTHRPTKYT